MLISSDIRLMLLVVYRGIYHLMMATTTRTKCTRIEFLITIIQFDKIPLPINIVKDL